MKAHYTLLLLLLFLGNVKAQDNLAIGQWRSLLPNTTGKFVTQTPDEIWYATDQSIMTFSKEDNSTDFIDRTDGLSDVDVAVMRYSPENDVVVVAYANSNIDLVSPNNRAVFNMDDIKRKTELQGDKRIYDILFLGNAAYLSCGFGIVKINLDRREVESTTFTNLKIRTLTVHEDVFYAASEEGIFTAPLTGINLLDFSAWGKLDMDEGFPDDYNSMVTYSYDGELYADINDTLFTYNPNTGILDSVVHVQDYKVNYLQSGNNRLIIMLQEFPFFGQKIFVKRSDGVLQERFSCLTGSGSSLVEDENGVLWYGDYGKGFYTYDLDNFVCGSETYNTPYSESCWDITFDENGKMWMAGGGINAGFQYSLNNAGFASWENGEWTQFNGDTYPILSGMWDYLDIEYNPRDNKVYVGSFIRGLTIYDGENFDIYNYTNSPISNAPGDAIENNRITGLEFDEEGILWMANNNANTPILSLDTDGTWKTFPVSGTKAIVQIAIDEADNKWFTTFNSGLVVFNEGNDFNNDADNSIRYITSTNSQLPSDGTNCLAVDNEGEVWVGTSQGVIIFDCGGNVFDTGNCRGELRIVEREDGNNEYLLKPENVRTIAVDGANRKWFGTENGVFVTSADGLEQIHHFTKDNSPLFSDKINTISINDDGEVFIATDAGIIVYKSDATTGKKVHSSSVYAYPNPVTSDYDGPIAINGLPQNADFKITDVNGTLIFEGVANGGQAIWNGRDYNGRRASSGVYLVFSANSGNLENPDGHVAKLLFMK